MRLVKIIATVVLLGGLVGCYAPPPTIYGTTVAAVPQPPMTRCGRCEGPAAVVCFNPCHY